MHKRAAMSWGPRPRKWPDLGGSWVTAVGEQFDACPCNQLSWPGLSGRSSEGCLLGSLRF